MLVHICCSVDSDYFLKRLCKEYAKNELIAYFYDPNIHPFSEYLLRLSDVKRSCKKLGIKLIAGEYDYENWLGGTKGLENEPEKGSRCKYCFDFRLENTAKKAIELGQKQITTTLLMSPKKEFQVLKTALSEICAKFNLEFLAPDFRKGGGTAEQFENAKKEKLYHQNYCGCLYALNMSRSEAHLTELSCPINRQIQPASSDERIKLYKKVRKCEKKGAKFELRKIKIDNYRLKSARVLQNEKVISSYFIFKSTMNKGNSSFKIAQNSKSFYSAKDYILLIDLKLFNSLAKTKYKSAKELYFNAPSLKTELKVRKKLCGELSQNAIIVLDKIENSSYKIELSSINFTSTCEKLVKFYNSKTFQS